MTTYAIKGGIGEYAYEHRTKPISSTLSAALQKNRKCCPYKSSVLGMLATCAQRNGKNVPSYKVFGPLSPELSI